MPDTWFGIGVFVSALHQASCQVELQADGVPLATAPLELRKTGIIFHQVEAPSIYFAVRARDVLGKFVRFRISCAPSSMENYLLISGIEGVQAGEKKIRRCVKDLRCVELQKYDGKAGEFDEATIDAGATETFIPAPVSLIDLDSEI
jgi:hypothetical protein